MKRPKTSVVKKRLTRIIMNLGQALRLGFIAIIPYCSCATGATAPMKSSEVSERLSWSPFDVIEAASSIVIGDVAQVVDLPDSEGFRVFKVQLQTVLRGPGKLGILYLLEDPPSDSLYRSAAALFPCRYLLFVQNVEAKHAPLAQRLARTLQVEPQTIVSTVSGWKGAVSLDARWAERSNKVLNDKWRIRENEIVVAASEFVSWFKIKSRDEQMQRIATLREKKGIYADFAESAAIRVQGEHSPP